MRPNTVVVLTVAFSLSAIDLKCGGVRHASVRFLITKHFSAECLSTLLTCPYQIVWYFYFTSFPIECSYSIVNSCNKATSSTYWTVLWLTLTPPFLLSHSTPFQISRFSLSSFFPFLLFQFFVVFCVVPCIFVDLRVWAASKILSQCGSVYGSLLRLYSQLPYRHSIFWRIASHHSDTHG